MKKIYLLSVLVLVTSSLFAAKIFLDPAALSWGTNIVPEDGNILRYANSRVIDSDLKTAIALKNEFLEDIEYSFNIKAYSNFELRFEEPLLIDKIVIYNGYQRSEDLYKKNDRVKDLLLRFFDPTNPVIGHVKYKRFGEIKSYLPNYTRTVELGDHAGKQEIKLGKILKIETIDFYVLSTYPGTKYTDICLSEIEFWYQGKKYEIANLEETEKEFLRQRVKVFPGIDIYFYFVYEFSDEFLAGLKQQGLKAEDVKYIELKEEDRQKRQGTLYGYSEEQFLKSIEDHPITFGDVFRHKAGLGKYFGDWKVDSYGNLWVKLGKRNWKRVPSNDQRVLRDDPDVPDDDHWCFEGTDMKFRGKIFAMEPYNYD